MNRILAGVSGRSIMMVVVGLLLCLSGAGPSLAGDKPEGDGLAKFTLTSPAFVDGGKLPEEYTCDGKRSSPPLEWSNAPVGTRSFAVTMHHIPGPGDQHVYMVIYNIPASVHSLESNSTDVGIWGINTVNGKQEYTPPCSKGPGPKKYTLTVYALSAKPRFEVSPDEVSMEQLMGAIKDKTLATATLSVIYERRAQNSANAGWESNAPLGERGNPAGPPDHGGPGQSAPGQGQGPRGQNRPGGQGGPMDQPRGQYGPGAQGQGPEQGPGQGGPQGRQGPPEMQAVARLNLSEQQKEKVDPILQDYRAKQDQLRAELLAKMKTVLDADQYQQFEQSMRRPPRRPEGDDNNRPPRPPGEQGGPPGQQGQQGQRGPGPGGPGGDW